MASIASRRRSCFSEVIEEPYSMSLTVIAFCFIMITRRWLSKPLVIVYCSKGNGRDINTGNELLQQQSSSDIPYPRGIKMADPEFKMPPTTPPTSMRTKPHPPPQIYEKQATSLRLWSVI
jgi:hypothetical protein